MRAINLQPESCHNFTDFDSYVKYALTLMDRFDQVQRMYNTNITFDQLVNYLRGLFVKFEKSNDNKSTLNQ